MNNTEDLLKLEQARLDKLRQDAQLRGLIKPQPINLRLRTAKVLERWAYRLSPELKLQHQL
jgi:hypothetical protein